MHYYQKDLKEYKRDEVDIEFTIDPYKQRAFSHRFAIDSKALKDAWYEVTIVAEVDGEPVILRKRLPVRVKKQ